MDEVSGNSADLLSLLEGDVLEVLCVQRLTVLDECIRTSNLYGATNSSTLLPSMRHNTHLMILRLLSWGLELLELVGEPSALSRAVVVLSTTSSVWEARSCG